MDWLGFDFKFQVELKLQGKMSVKNQNFEIILYKCRSALENCHYQSVVGVFIQVSINTWMLSPSSFSNFELRRNFFSIMSCNTNLNLIFFKDNFNNYLKHIKYPQHYHILT